MINDLRYTVRSREIVDLVAAMRNGTITLSPYFQRNLVWRDAHKRDFIDTILCGYPFPQIFLARGPIDLERMSASQAVVDGQQRLNAIRDFVSGKLEVHGKKFSELSQQSREEFLKYEVAVIDFDLDAGDARLKDVFHRLNRTYYSLSAIEKLASEYSASEFMLIARLLCGEISRERTDSDFFDISSEELESESDRVSSQNIFSRDPGIDDDTWNWLLARADGAFARLTKNSNVFTPFEFDRKVPLMFALNVMCTYITGYYERNDRVRRLLDDFAFSFTERQDVLDSLNGTAEFIASMQLPPTSAWWNKANFFTIVVELSRDPSLRASDPGAAKARLISFSDQFPETYTLAAREAVGRKPQRETRGQMVRAALRGELQLLSK